jgi:hypothetical protein
MGGSLSIAFSKSSAELRASENNRAHGTYYESDIHTYIIIYIYREREKPQKQAEMRHKQACTAQNIC